MDISSIIVDSFQEYSGEHSLVLFSTGCNFRCIYCYNYEEVCNGKSIGNAIDVIEQNLNPMHTAVVFLGGEPTIWGDDLLDAMTWVKSKGLKVKLYTNGSNLQLVKEMINRKIIDAISIDLKTLDSNIGEVVSPELTSSAYLLNFTTIAYMVLESKIDIEVRTTIYDGLDVNRVKRFMGRFYPNVRFILTKDFRKNFQ